MENLDQKRTEALRESLTKTLNELADVFSLDKVVLLEKMEEVILSGSVEKDVQVWEGVNHKLKENALAQTEKLRRLRGFLIKKGYEAMKPFGQQDETDAILAKLHTYLWDKGSAALPHKGGQAELFYFVANKIFNIE